MTHVSLMSAGSGRPLLEVAQGYTDRTVLLTGATGGQISLHLLSLPPQQDSLVMCLGWRPGKHLTPLTEPLLQPYQDPWAVSVCCNCADAAAYCETSPRNVAWLQLFSCTSLSLTA